jgi:hypothetical protein
MTKLLTTPFQFLKAVSKEMVVIFFSVLLAFTVDRCNQNYQEKEKLHTALLNIHAEMNDDLTHFQKETLVRLDEFEKNINESMSNDTLSLFDMDKKGKLFWLNSYSVSLGYIEKNPNLSFDNELQSLISEVLSANHEFEFDLEELKKSRYRDDFYLKGEQAKIAKMRLQVIISEIKHRILSLEKITKKIETLLKNRNILKK